MVVTLPRVPWIPQTKPASYRHVPCKRAGLSLVLGMQSCGGKVQGRTLTGLLSGCQIQHTGSQILRAPRSKQPSHTPEPYGRGRGTIFDFPVSIQLADSRDDPNNVTFGQGDIFFQPGDVVLLSKNRLGYPGSPWVSMGLHAFKPVKLESINNPTVSARAISCVPDDWSGAQSRPLLFKKESLFSSRGYWLWCAGSPGLG